MWDAANMKVTNKSPTPNQFIHPTYESGWALGRRGGDAVDAATAGIGLAGNRGPGQLRRFSHEAMTTVFEVYVAGADARYAAQAAQAASPSSIVSKGS